jgi:hypothetical protein
MVKWKGCGCVLIHFVKSSSMSWQIVQWPVVWSSLTRVGFFLWFTFKILLCSIVLLRVTLVHWLRYSVSSLSKNNFPWLILYCTFLEGRELICFFILKRRRMLRRRKCKHKRRYNYNHYNSWLHKQYITDDLCGKDFVYLELRLIDVQLNNKNCMNF